MRHKIRPNSVQNGYHHPESSAARIAKQIDDDMFNNEDMSAISNAAGGSFAHPPMTALPGRQLADFSFISELGRGAHGVVHKVKSKIDNGMYVIKEIRLANLKPKRRKMLHRKYCFYGNYTIQISYNITHHLLKTMRCILLWNMLMVEICIVS